MGLTILLITLIVLACLFVVFLGREAKKISNAYLNSVNYCDADANKPTFIRINDDRYLDYIFNTNEIYLITAVDSVKGDEYLLRVCLKDEDKTDITFTYDDKLVRDQIYDALSDYNICDKIVFCSKSNE